jgi:hypothetical protein
MNLILGIILSLFTATYTLESTTAVVETGTAPTYSSYSYERTATSGRKGQMTAGNETRLKLSGWDGCVIKTVALEMRSNKASGAGSLAMTIGTDTVWSIINEPFSSEKWAGKYSEDWTTIAKRMSVAIEAGKSIEITISASENSLYINSYKITYEAPEPQCYAVSFVTGMGECPSSIVQTSVGQPIVLPNWKDTADWYFVGWSECEIVDEGQAPVLLKSGSDYLPKSDITLWAVYSNVKEFLPVTDYKTGVYIMAWRSRITDSVLDMGVVLVDAVDGGSIAVTGVQMEKNADGLYVFEGGVNEEMLYNLEFDGDDVYITHSYPESPIGYRENKLDAISVPWQYKVLDDGSVAFYYSLSNAEYALYVLLGADEKPIVTSKSIDMSKWKEVGFWLYPVQNASYTSWPLGKWTGLDEQEIFEREGETVFQWGIYELHVKNGKKVLYLNQR